MSVVSVTNKRYATTFRILLQNANIDENNFCKHGGNIVKIVEQKYVFAMLLLATQCKHCMDVKKKELSQHLFHSS